jgi:protocatechuate 3,4-dioxygenase beta subunit
MAAYSIENLDRRDILLMSVVLAGSGAILPLRGAAAEAALQRTPDQILGPFYPLKELPQTADLTRVPGRPGHAEGQVINVMGRVLNLAGQPGTTRSELRWLRRPDHGRRGPLSLQDH